MGSVSETLVEGQRMSDGGILLVCQGDEKKKKIGTGSQTSCR